jgi:hypothetical protein
MPRQRNLWAIDTPNWRWGPQVAYRLQARISRSGASRHPDRHRRILRPKPGQPVMSENSIALKTSGPWGGPRLDLWRGPVRTIRARAGGELNDPVVQGMRHSVCGASGAKFCGRGCQMFLVRSFVSRRSKSHVFPQFSGTSQSHQKCAKSAVLLRAAGRLPALRYNGVQFSPADL